MNQTKWLDPMSSFGCVLDVTIPQNEGVVFPGMIMKTAIFIAPMEDIKHYLEPAVPEENDPGHVQVAVAPLDFANLKVRPDTAEQPANNKPNNVTHASPILSWSSLIILLLPANTPGIKPPKGSSKIPLPEEQPYTNTDKGPEHQVQCETHPEQCGFHDSAILIFNINRSQTAHDTVRIPLSLR